MQPTHSLTSKAAERAPLFLSENFVRFGACQALDQGSCVLMGETNAGNRLYLLYDKPARQVAYAVVSPSQLKVKALLGVHEAESNPSTQALAMAVTDQQLFTVGLLAGEPLIHFRRGDEGGVDYRSVWVVVRYYLENKSRLGKKFRVSRDDLSPAGTGDATYFDLDAKHCEAARSAIERTFENMPSVPPHEFICFSKNGDSFLVHPPEPQRLPAAA